MAEISTTESCQTSSNARRLEPARYQDSDLRADIDHIDGSSGYDYAGLDQTSPLSFPKGSCGRLPVVTTKDRAACYAISEKHDTPAWWPFGHM